MQTAEAEFVAKIREQVKFLRDEEYAYDELRVYASGIVEPWVFGPDDEFEFDNEVLIVRVGPTKEQENQGVPEYTFPIRHICRVRVGVLERVVPRQVSALVPSEPVVTQDPATNPSSAASAQSSPSAAQLPLTSQPAPPPTTKTERLATMKLLLEVLAGLVGLIAAILTLFRMLRN